MEKLDGMLYPVIKIDYSFDATNFVATWGKLYNYPDYDVYTKLLRNKFLDSDDLYKLFKWKNRMDLSGKKRETYESKIKIHLGLINKYRQERKSIEISYEGFKNIPAIWRIFLLHIIQPLVYPIFDQHVYRAYAVINKLDKKELPLNNKEKFRIYDDLYVPFFFDFGGENKQNDYVANYNNFEIDKALWAFGKAFKQYPLLFTNLYNESSRL